MSQTARVMERRQIEALINYDKVEITLYRKTRTRMPDNSWSEGSPTPLDPQKAALIPFKRRMTEFLVNTELGKVPDLPYILLGPHDMNVERGDTFTHNGEHLEVITVDELKREARTACQVDYFGGAPT